MKPFKRTLIELFGEKRRYIVPLYQRKYAWAAEPNLRLLWEDVLNAVGQINVDRTKITPHFMGAMVIAQKKTFGQSVPTFEVIDGQQRLTTIQLFLIAFRDAVAESSPDYETELSNYILNTGLMADPSLERYKLWPTITDRRQFVALCDPAIETDGAMFDVDASGSEGIKIQEAYDFFFERVESHVFVDQAFDELKTAHLLEALKDYLAVVVIELEDGDDPQTIFETLNSRGVDLTHSDLIRNMIFQRASAFEMESGNLASDKLYKAYWLPLDRSFWTSVDSRGRQSLPRLDWMLTDYLSMQKGKAVSSTHLANEYREWSKNEAGFDSIEAELKEISVAAINAKRIMSQDENDCLGNFGKLSSIFDISTTFPLVLYLAKHASDEAVLQECLSYLESYIVRRDICRLTNKNYNNVFIDILRQLDGEAEDLATNFANLLRGGDRDTNIWPSDRQFFDGWMHKKQYQHGRQKRLVYVLTKIEQELACEFSEGVEYTSQLTIEHIMPRKWREHWPIKKEEESSVKKKEESSVDEGEFELPPGWHEEILRDNSVDRLGNLTLLVQKLNSSISNGPFDEKLEAITSHSRMTLNLNLQDYQEWNEDAINSRAEDHAKLALKIWKIV